MSMPKYSLLTDSGVDWLGQVPKHWRIKRLRFVTRLNPSKSELSSLDRETLVSFLPMQAVGDDGTLNLEQDRPLESVEQGYTYFRDGDVTVAKITPCFENGKGALMTGLTNGVGFGTTELIVARPCIGEVTSKYLHYLFVSAPFRRIGESSMYGAGGQKRVPDDFVRDFKAVFPPVSEQEIITSFLDQETSKIDALISEQQRLIELLKEKRQAVISHAVTKGLNPDVRMKPSGIEWLGEVPEHWEVKKLKRVSPFMSVGIVVNPSSFVCESDDGLPFIYGGDIREGQIDYLNSRRISSAASRTEEKTMLQEGDLLTVRVGAPGVTAVVPKECDGGNCASVMLMRKGAFNSDWLCYVMNARLVRFQVEIVQYGAAQQQFNISHAVNFLIPVPPRAEQDSLVAALDAQLDGFNRLQVEAEKAIGLLQERRTALISAAVTGKIDVRNYAVSHKDAA